MKITYRSNGHMPLHEIEKDLIRREKEYGLTVKGMTCYVRFQDEFGKITEPLVRGAEIEETVDFIRGREITKEGNLSMQPQ